MEMKSRAAQTLLKPTTRRTTITTASLAALA
jgi:hypothetical protein